ncbi:MAG TPA: uroporphyrinogen-III synthase [Terriglobia bacterium]|nr:uroporphyrinogen-III synthase [Terriglobia bacterium]
MELDEVPEKSSSVETLPLLGRRILITRPQEQSEEFGLRLGQLGAEVISLPTIEICDPDCWKPLEEAIHQIDRYEWLIFTSVNGVKRFFERWKLVGRELKDLNRIQICAIGASTGKEIASVGLHPQVIPDEFRAEGLLESLKGRVLPGSRILIPRARIARDVLPETLRSWGAEVNVVEAYRTLPAYRNKEALLENTKERPVDMITFTSSSSVASLAELLAPRSLKEFLAKVAVASIGPVTSRTATEYGLIVSVEPQQYDIPSLVEAIRCYYEV